MYLWVWCCHYEWQFYHLQNTMLEAGPARYQACCAYNWWCVADFHANEAQHEVHTAASYGMVMHAL